MKKGNYLFCKKKLHNKIRFKKISKNLLINHCKVKQAFIQLGLNKVLLIQTEVTTILILSVVVKYL